MPRGRSRTRRIAPRSGYVSRSRSASTPRGMRTWATQITRRGSRTGVYGNDVSRINQSRGNPAPLGDRLYTSLEYAYTQAVSGTGYADQVFRLNSAYDLDYTNTGAQPEGFDELMAFFQKCRVNCFEIEATFINTSSIAVQMAVYPANIIGTYSNVDQIRAFPRCKWKIANYGNAAPSAGITIRAKYLPRDIIGDTRAAYQDEDYACTTSANPVHTPFCHVSFGALDGASTVTGYLMYRIRIKCEFYDRRQLNLS